MQTTGAPAATRVAHRLRASLGRAPTARLPPQCNLRSRRGRSLLASSLTGVCALCAARHAFASTASRHCASSSLFSAAPEEGQAGTHSTDAGMTAERLSDRQPGPHADTREGDDVTVDAADVYAALGEGDVAGASSPSDAVPRVEPTSAAARAALEQRRALFAHCTTLEAVVDAELHAEVARDMADGVAAVPPLAPSGWRVVHSAGTSFFTMSRVLHGGYLERGVVRSDAPGSTDGRGGAAPSPPAGGLPRYRSVHDMMTGAAGGRGGGGAHAGGRTHRSAEATTQDLWVLRRGRYVAAEAAAADTDKDEHVRGGAVPCVARSDTHVTLFAPFRTLDLTVFDPRVDICEWTRFDALVRKVRPASASSPPSPVLSVPEGQQEVWDEGRCMFARLACVNGELRLRSVQFVSHRIARALEEHAVFGKGEPLYLELLRRLPGVAAAGTGKRARAAGTSTSAMATSAASPVHYYDAPDAATPTPAAAATASGSSIAADSASVLTTQFDRNGEYARSFVYGGPYLTELSKELREALTEYVMMDLGVTSEVAEYVCQLQYFLEQEEYVSWLARWGQLATNLKRTL